MLKLVVSKKTYWANLAEVSMDSDSLIKNRNMIIETLSLNLAQYVSCNSCFCKFKKSHEIKKILNDKSLVKGRCDFTENS